MLQLGILGLGEGRSALAAIATMEGCEARWICDIDRDLLESTRKEFSIANATADYEEMLADPAVDAIMIYTPDPYHAEHILMAFSAGKHIICTKPMLDSLDQGRQLLDAEKSSGNKLIVGQTCRFFPTFMRQREDFERGLHGSIISCEAHYNGDKRRGSAGKRGKNGQVNWLYSGLCHPVDLAFWFLGPIQSVTGMSYLSPAGKRLGSRVPDCFHTILEAESGALGQVSGVYGAAETNAAACPASVCILRGDKGSSVAQNPQFTYATNFDHEPQTMLSFPDECGEYFPWGGSKYHVGETRNLLVQFLKSLTDNDAPSPDLRDGLKVTAILKAIELSIESKRAVEVAEVLAASGLEGI